MSNFAKSLTTFPLKIASLAFKAQHPHQTRLFTTILGPAGSSCTLKFTSFFGQNVFLLALFQYLYNYLFFQQHICNPWAFHLSCSWSLHFLTWCFVLWTISLTWSFRALIWLLVSYSSPTKLFNEKSCSRLFKTAMLFSSSACEFCWSILLPHHFVPPQYQLPALVVHQISWSQWRAFFFYSCVHVLREFVQLALWKVSQPRRQDNGSWPPGGLAVKDHQMTTNSFPEEGQGNSSCLVSLSTE